MLKLNPLNSKKAALAFMTLSFFTGLNCGKRGVPLPPVERIQQRVEISGRQRGNIVILSWQMPGRNATEGNTLAIDHVDIYRLIEPVDTSLSLTEENFASRSTLIASVALHKSDFARKLLTYSDTLEFAEQKARIRYAIRFVNDAGQKAAFSNFLLIEPTAKAAVQPTNLRAEISETAIKLNWTAPEVNIDGSKPANVLGYNVFVTTGENEPELKNPTPINGTDFFDNSFEFGINYKYFVRTVSLSSDGEPIESLNSNTVEILPKDIFAPSPPSALTIAAAPNNISIFFAINPEKDIAGYRIYRSTSPNQNKSEWTPLTGSLIKTNTFLDTKIETGKTYYYFLTAIDTNGNTSEPSEVVSEKAQ